MTLKPAQGSQRSSRRQSTSMESGTSAMFDETAANYREDASQASSNEPYMILEPRQSQLNAAYDGADGATYPSGS